MVALGECQGACLVENPKDHISARHECLRKAGSMMLCHTPHTDSPALKMIPRKTNERATLNSSFSSSVLLHSPLPPGGGPRLKASLSKPHPLVRKIRAVPPASDRTRIISSDYHRNKGRYQFTQCLNWSLPNFLEPLFSQVVKLVKQYIWCCFLVISQDYARSTLELADSC